MGGGHNYWNLEKIGMSWTDEVIVIEKIYVMFTDTVGYTQFLNFENLQKGPEKIENLISVFSYGTIIKACNIV